MRIILFSLIGLMMLSGCEKDSISNSPSDFVITLFREFTNGQTSMEIERPAVKDQIKGPNVYFDADGDELILRIGQHVQTDTKLGANIVFLNATDPMNIIGTYAFPADRDKVDIELFEYTANGFSRTSIPSEGTLTVKYDPQRKRFSGSVDQLKYEIPFRSDYVFQLISMKFDGVVY